MHNGRVFPRSVGTIIDTRQADQPLCLHFRHPLLMDKDTSIWGMGRVMYHAKW
jgi:hypothetical protein